LSYPGETQAGNDEAIIRRLNSSLLLPGGLLAGTPKLIASVADRLLDFGSWQAVRWGIVSPNQLETADSQDTQDFRSTEAIIATASIVSTSKAELDQFREQIALSRKHVVGARSCIEESIEALNQLKDKNVPVPVQHHVEGGKIGAPYGRRLKGSTLTPKILLSDVYGPETLKMIYEVFDDLLRLTVAERTVTNASDDFELRRQLAEILLTLHAEGEKNPILLRRKALERFRGRQKRS
jgi:hypothetical protein